MIQLLRNLFFHDFLLKCFSLILAVLIWKIVSLAISHEVAPGSGPLPLLTERTFTNVPVRVITSAGDQRTFQVEPSQVQVTVQGEGRAMENLTMNDIRALVDLTGIESAHGLQKQIEVTTPAGTTATRITPDQISATVSPKP